MPLNPFKLLFGSGKNVVTETMGAFRENSEAGAQRRAEFDQAALAQYAAEFKIARTGRFDRFMDGLNRLPRPLMVLTVFMLFAAAMIDPLWFAARMTGLALVPEPLWWFAGTVVTFYFGGRFQIKSQEFHKAALAVADDVPRVLGRIKEIEAMRHDTPGAAGRRRASRR